VFVACVECFRVVTEQRLLGSPAVIPGVCPACQKLVEMRRRRLGLPTGGIAGSLARGALRIESGEEAKATGRATCRLHKGR